jgi:microcystin-dependent protein
MNYMWWLTDQWVQYLDEQVSSEASLLTLLPSVRLLGGGDWSWNASTGTLSWSAAGGLSVPGILDTANTFAAGSVVLGETSVAYISANIPFSALATTVLGSPQIKMNYEIGIDVGEYVFGPGIPAGATVIAVSGQTVTLSAGATASGAAQVSFYGTPAITVQSCDVSALVPGPATIVIARASGGACAIGATSGQAYLRDTEVRTLDGPGFLSSASLPAGQGLTNRQFVYTALAGSGRTVGAVYPADAGATNQALRSQVLGCVATSAASVSTGATAYVVTEGTVAGFTGLTAGAAYYLDPATPGGITATQPTGSTLGVVGVGTALSATTLRLLITRVPDSSIAGTKLIPASVTGTQIGDASVPGTKLAPATVTGTQIGDASVPGTKLIPASVTGAQIASDTVTLANLVAAVAAALNPTGLIAPFGGATAPAGWLMADGSAVSRLTYSALFAVIGVTHGAGDGVNTFNLPNTQGVFLRGAGTQSINSISYSATRGASQSDQAQGHIHTYGGNTGGQSVNHSHYISHGAYTGSTNAYGLPGTTFVAGTQGWAAPQNSGGFSADHSHAFSGSTSTPANDGPSGAPRTGSETRPANIAVNYIIKT